MKLLLLLYQVLFERMLAPLIDSNGKNCEDDGDAEEEETNDDPTHCLPRQHVHRRRCPKLTTGLV